MAMERMTFTVPADIKRKAQANPEINWSAVVAKAIKDRLDFWDRLEAFAQTSKLTQKDVDEIAESINRNMARRLEQKFGPYGKAPASSSTRTES